MPRRSSIHVLASVVAELREELRRSRRENLKLPVENEVLREAAEPLIHNAPARERFAFIHARRERFSVRLLCRVLVTDRSNYHGGFAPKRCAVSARAMTDGSRS